MGLHARAATKFANTAKRFGCNVQVRLGTQTIDGKSIMSLMLLAAAKGSVLTLTTEGCDENEAMSAIDELLARRFDEPD
ncbi:MAG: phosphocarrier protein HPr [Flavobacteriales bacterium]